MSQAPLLPLPWPQTPAQTHPLPPIFPALLPAPELTQQPDCAPPEVLEPKHVVQGGAQAGAPGEAVLLPVGPWRTALLLDAAQQLVAAGTQGVLLVDQELDLGLDVGWRLGQRLGLGGEWGAGHMWLGGGCRWWCVRLGCGVMALGQGDSCLVLVRLVRKALRLRNDLGQRVVHVDG